MYKFKDFEIPTNMLESIERYIDKGILPGNFLQAVISNDLKEAVGRADHKVIRNLPAYVGYFYNIAPSNCWGSREIMLDYANDIREKRMEEKQI